MNLQTAAQIDSHWKESPRWKGVARGYAAADVVRLRGTVHVEHSLARLGAEKLWRYLHELPFVNAEAQQAIRQTGGIKFILGTGCVVPITAPYGNLLAASSPETLKI